MANPIRWLWNAARNLFRRAPGGRPLSEGTITNLRNAQAAARADFISGITTELAMDEITVQQWVTRFRAQLKTSYIQQYLTARGGRNAMTQADWGSLGGQLSNQYRYMNQFAAEISSERLSPAQIEARMRLYFESSTQAFERGRAAVYGLIMPQYPGDGQTQCRTNCKCEWKYERREDGAGWDCTWKLNPAEHCPDCINNSQRWNPLFVPG